MLSALILSLETEMTAETYDSSPYRSLIDVWLIILTVNCIIILRDFYYLSVSALQSFLNICLHLWKLWTESKSRREEFPTKRLCIDRVKEPNQKMKTITGRPKTKNKITSAKASCSYSNVDGEELTISEVTMVMGKLGTSYDPDGDELQQRLGSHDIAALFEEQAPSIQEAEQAFSVFDENNDGFIDAKELRKVLCTLRFVEASEAYCKRMITAYDENADGLIDFKEFQKLVANSFN